MAIVVELLSRDDKVINHYFVNKNTLSIGRAYDNDVRIDDPYVCPHHITFEESILDDEPSIRICDNGSLNGVKVNRNPVVESQIGSSDIITIGRSRIRVFHHHKKISPTIHLSQLEEDIDWMSSRKVCAALLAVFCAMVATQYFVNSIVEVKFFLLFKVVLTLIGAATIWPFAFALLSKLAKKDANIISQFSVLWIFLIGIEVTDYLYLWLEFNFNPSAILNIFILALKGVLFLALLWFSLFIAFHQANKVRNRMAIAGLVLIAIPTLSPYFIGQDQFRFQPSYSVVILPPMFNISSPSSSEEYVEDSASIFSALAEEKRKEGQK